MIEICRKLRKWLQNRYNIKLNNYNLVIILDFLANLEYDIRCRTIDIKLILGRWTDAEGNLALYGLYE